MAGLPGFRREYQYASNSVVDEVEFTAGSSSVVVLAKECECRRRPCRTVYRIDVCRFVGECRVEMEKKQNEDILPFSLRSQPFWAETRLLIEHSAIRRNLVCGVPSLFQRGLPSVVT